MQINDEKHTMNAINTKETPPIALRSDENIIQLSWWILVKKVGGIKKENAIEYTKMNSTIVALPIST